MSELRRGVKDPWSFRLGGSGEMASSFGGNLLDFLSRVGAGLTTGLGGGPGTLARGLEFPADGPACGTGSNPGLSPVLTLILNDLPQGQPARGIIRAFLQSVTASASWISIYGFLQRLISRLHEVFPHKIPTHIAGVDPLER